jgi:UDP-N-acetylmuramoyl-L-alanyl-D-glutamate--2,6-diaminopimelate ligase
MPPELTLGRLAAALAGHQHVRVVGDDVGITDVQHDSRHAGPGVLFVAVPGSLADGHDFAPAAVAAGAAALLVERRLPLDVPQIIVDDARAALPWAAAEVHGHPARSLDVVGITGTNGKTTVTYMLESIARSAAIPTGVIGTIGASIVGTPVPLGRTTPESSDLQRLLRRMVDEGVRLVAMEVSSHSLAYGRVTGITFDVAAFTNLSQDHLDFHRDMEDYFATKAALFTPGHASRAVIWLDEPWGRRLAAAATIPIRTVGWEPDADLHVADLVVTATGSRFLVTGDETIPVTVPLAGRFNAANAAVAAACALELGIPAADISAGLARLPPVSGRFQRVDAGQAFTVVVDYAHTPDAISAVVAEARHLVPGRVIVVLGAGGDRDHSKRATMGAAAATADLAILTTDNPRSEDPAAILAQVAAGVPAGAGVRTELDRARAIALAVEAADDGDAVLILGKGHEQGQELAGGVVIPFDDREIAAAAVRARLGEGRP